MLENHGTSNCKMCSDYSMALRRAYTDQLRTCVMDAWNSHLHGGSQLTIDSTLLDPAAPTITVPGNQILPPEQSTLGELQIELNALMEAKNARKTHTDTYELPINSVQTLQPSHSNSENRLGMILRFVSPNQIAN